MTDRDRDRPKQLEEMTPADFVDQLTGGSGRWVFTALALLSLAALALPLLAPEPAKVTLFGLNPDVERWVIVAVAAIWGTLAIVNWRNWRGRGRGG